LRFEEALLRAVEVIQKKREGERHTREELEFLVQGLVDGSIPDYQVSAWLMAVFFRGLDFEETGWLTRAMIASGETFNLAGVRAPLVDKHSTGGVGDKLSLMIAPLASACGLAVPMMSGRALGHTGGTLDKLEAISGYRTQLSESELRACLAECGYFMTGQSERVVPADRLMYALRDVSGTVESIPLITASILSKKFAEGAQALVFDVKCGRGAFMKTPEQARNLAVSLVETAKSLGRPAVALVTAMDTPLGRTVGNFLEVEETVDFLHGRTLTDTAVLVFRLVAWMLLAARLVQDVEAGEALARKKLADGSAWARFARNVAFQGGDLALLESQIGRRRAAFCTEVLAPQDGFLTAVDAGVCGLAATALGAGRSQKGDQVLPLVGLEFLGFRGDWVRQGSPVVKVWAENEAQGEKAASDIRKALSWGTEPPPPTPWILEEISGL
jgi:pyrimidine-nucleoside phosphorylase